MESRGITNVFIAYSHKDIDLISPIVRLLRVGWAQQRLIFHDVDSITLGKKWREERDEALTHADLVLVFWCFHSSKSDEVQYEYQAAISAEKDLLPLLLDTTPLPADLREFQWIDFQNLSGSGHELPLPPVQESAKNERPIIAVQAFSRSKTRVSREGPFGVPAAEDLELGQYIMLKVLEEEFSRRTRLPAPQLPY